MKFAGFSRPRSNFYRLPNDWFDIWRQIRRQTGQTRILGVLKVVEYVMKWTWGYGNFADPVRLSWSDFLEGRRSGDRRLDRGTGISSRATLSSAITLAVQVGLLEKTGSSYLPRLIPPDQDEAGFLDTEADTKFGGFASPEANYFVVPAIWTDLSASASSETVILVVEYFFRHTWGWRGGWDEPCWMTEEEVATGRRKASGERYDQGIGYSVRSVHDAIQEAVRRGWLVFRHAADGRGREYALHLEKMQVSDEGEFLGQQTSRPRSEPVRPGNAQEGTVTAAHTVSPDVQQRIVALENHIRRLTAILLGILQVLERAGIDVRLLPGYEEVVLDLEESVPVPEESVPVLEETVPVREETVPTYNTDTLSDTKKKTPAADTGGQIADAGTAAGAVLSLPDDLRQKLDALNFRGRRPMQELLEAYRKEPDRIRWWIEHLFATRAGDPQAGGFLLQTVVREGAPVPVSVSVTGGKCSFCGGRGVVLADVPPEHPLHNQEIPCPRCQK